MKKINITLIIFAFIFQAITVRANQYIEQVNNSVPFSVRAKLPENQISDVSFFEIEMEIGQVQELEVIITNNSKEDINVEIETHTAATNSNGVITYDGNIDFFDQSMENQFSELVEPVEGIVTVPSQSEYPARVRVTAPDKSFDGQILGGIQFKLAEKEDEVESEDISIQQSFSYVIGVNIVEKGNDKQISSELVLNNVSLETVSGRSALQTEFINKSSVLIRDLVFEGAIYPKVDPEQSIYQREVKPFSVAPHNIFNFPIFFEDGNLIAGEYIFKGSARNADEEWFFEETFVVE